MQCAVSAAFRGQLVKRRITDRRIAEDWIGKQVMYGGEITGESSGISGASQFHAGTVQWRAPGGQIGWIELIQPPPINPSADRHGLVLFCSGDVSLHIHSPGLTAARIKQSEWDLPGLTVHLAEDATRFQANPGEHDVEAKYSHITKMALKIDPTVQGKDARSQRVPL